jgi:hypothetical protein
MKVLEVGGKSRCGGRRLWRVKRDRGRGPSWSMSWQPLLNRDLMRRMLRLLPNLGIPSKRSATVAMARARSA